MTPLERYHAEGARPDFVQDPDQLAAITRLDALYHTLMEASRASRRRLKWWPAPRITAPRGLYLWGGVGRGKTFVVDTFCASLPDTLRVRVHFHSFMRDVHARLRQLRGAQDPLREIAAGWSRDMRLLCLDEFHVVDITDAMLLGQLLAALFARGVTLVTTSNEAPDDLYRGGLQRERFLPAIAMLKQHLEVFEFGGATDYRWRTLTRAATYYAPADEAAERALADCWMGLTRQTAAPAPPLEVEGRQIPVRARADGAVWFTFSDLCDGPRGTLDYIEIACCHHTVLLSGVPCFGDESADAARRFINLVDEFYDRGVNLLLSAAAPPDQLYAGARLAASFRRTASRLVEMQSQQYLAKPHLADVSNLSKSDI
jgi:cell division protein ZapE